MYLMPWRRNPISAVVLPPVIGNAGTPLNTTLRAGTSEMFSTMRLKNPLTIWSKRMLSSGASRRCLEAIISWRIPLVSTVYQRIATPVPTKIPSETLIGGQIFRKRAGKAKNKSAEKNGRLNHLDRQILRHHMEPPSARVTSSVDLIRSIKPLRAMGSLPEQGDDRPGPRRSAPRARSAQGSPKHELPLQLLDVYG